MTVCIEQLVARRLAAISYNVVGQRPASGDARGIARSTWPPEDEVFIGIGPY